MKPKLKIRKLLFVLFAICFLFNCHLISNAQKKTDSLATRRVSSFSINSDLANWLCLNPNIGMQYRINKLFAVNTDFTVHPYGINWTRFFFTDHSTFLEQWTMQGYEITAGLKVYPEKNFYCSLQLCYKSESFPEQKISFGTGDESRYNFQYEEMQMKSYGFNLTFGLENRSYRRFFEDFYFGVGYNYEMSSKTIYGIYNWGLVAGTYPETTRARLWIPRFFLGYNLGVRVTRHKYPEDKRVRKK